MGRLIDVDDLILEYEKSLLYPNLIERMVLRSILKKISKIPTAYSRFTVHLQLYNLLRNDMSREADVWNSAIFEADDIVKRGGVDDRMKNTDDITTKAVGGLDTFTKNWCMNCEETEKQNDLIFRCNECEFCQPDGKCMIKTFAINHESDYPMEKFGSMVH